ncbi:MAG: TlpA family protein disulfide reductase, partial [Cyanobacteria bacterium REEB67]|nr:TlpA family protein disulfide reductase [Cyanobacteria bacterium REEB67]
DGVQTNHLRLESHRVSYDVWVDAGDKPWVRKVQAESTKHKDQTQRIIVTHYEMNGSAKPSAATFSFKAPASAKEIPSFFGQAKEATKEAAAPDQSVKVSHSANPLLNKPAPELSLDTVGGGKLDLSSYKDKNVVVLDFWATWCPPCRMSLPILSEVTKAYEDKGVKFFAIDLKEDTSKVKEFLKNQNLDINVALDKDGQAAGKYGVQSIPQSVIIGKDGTVRVVHVGFNSNLKARLAAELDEALTGKEVVAQ